MLFGVEGDAGQHDVSQTFYALDDRAMKQEVHERLIESDDDGIEVPGGDWDLFSYQMMADNVEKIRKQANQLFGLNLSKDGNVQDASFHEDLAIHLPVEGRQNEFYTALCIRFSNFGRLFTIFGHSKEDLATYPVSEIRNFVELNSWVYVPSEELHCPYDGQHKHLVESGITWWKRFFDYL